MREINLENYQVRTDLITDIISRRKIEGIEEIIKNVDNIKVSNVKVLKDNQELNKSKGNYTTIFFDDVTDNTNRNKVIEVFVNELKKILEDERINKDDSCLIVGLGNISSTPDSLGPKVANGVIITRHIYLLVGSLEKGYRITSMIVPGVMGNTGYDSSDSILGVIDKIKPKFIIAIDALASDRVDRVNKTIQITNTGINPGSGVGNRRIGLTKKTLGIPVIAIGVPTVVDATTIVLDTINYMIKHFSYNLKNIDNPNLKFIPSNMRNYLKEENLNLNFEQKKQLLGLVGSLDDVQLKTLLQEVLTPIGYNLMVTPKEVDFVIDKLKDVLISGINKSLHDIN